MLRVLVLALLLGWSAAADDLTCGYSLVGLHYTGPGRWQHTTDPIWVFDYHTLQLTYRAEGFTRSSEPVLILRPGAVGPVTPGALNPENPFAAGKPLTVLTAAELRADGASHTIDIELRGKTKTAQVDQVIFSLPAGARLTVERMEFAGGRDVLPPATSGAPLPAGVRNLAATAAQTYAGLPATTLRGRESIRIDGGGRRGAAVYLSLWANLAGVSSYSAEAPFERWRWKETSETGNLLIHIEYADGSAEDQFPELARERRHALLNRTTALYVVAVDAARPLASVELSDRSPHVQLVLFGAGLSAKPVPEANDATLAVPAPANGPVRASRLDGSVWYQLDADPKANLHATLTRNREAEGQTAALSLTNRGREQQQLRLRFPVLKIRPAAAARDVYYLFPAQRALIGQDEQPHEAAYSGAFPLQFLDVFSPAANSGVCMIVRDQQGRSKTFSIQKTGATVSAAVEYAVKLGPGETFRAPDVLLAEHGGDWRQGLAAYRNWVASWYRPNPLRPAWLDSAFWARRDYPIGGSGHLYDTKTNRYTFDGLIDDARALGGADFIDISGWALSNTAGRVGDYSIDLGGIANLRRNIDEARGRGVPTGLYFEGYLVDRNSNVGRRHGAQWQIINADGTPRWWQGGAELFVCPYVSGWQQYLSGRVADVARGVGAAAVYLDEYGFGNKRCYSSAHGHPAGVDTLEGELAMVRAVRKNLAAAGRADTAIYIEETPPDAAAPFYDAAFCYALPYARSPQPSPKLNLWRFVFPRTRLWDMLSVGVHPRQLSSEDFRLSLWHGDGIWLKGHIGSWYGQEILSFLARAHKVLRRHSEAFSGAAEPMVPSPHPSVFINRFDGGGETVYTLFNAAYRTVSLRFAGRALTIAPREVEVVALQRPPS
ncbi:MAG: hypothetical protein IT160_17415 [Bryobacterales bacterium]|nr:hypothetical protein [Bryobacterales bacterium]